MTACPIPCALRGGSAIHLLCAGVAICFALYLFLTWREMQRMDVKIHAITQQMAALHKTTDHALSEMRAAVEASTLLPADLAGAAGGVPIPLVIERVVAAGGGPARVVEELDVDDGDCEDEDEDEDDVQERQDADDRQLKEMLMAHLDGIDEQERAVEEGAPPPPSPEDEAGSGTAAGSRYTEESVRAMKVDDLRKALKDMGADPRGTKDALVARLLQAQAQQHE